MLSQSNPSLSTVYTQITFLLTLITSWLFSSHSHFDLVIIPTFSSSSARLLTSAITPSLTSSHTASVQQFTCYHPSNSLLTALNAFPSCPHPEVLSAACSVSPVSTNRLSLVCACLTKLSGDMFESFGWPLVAHRWTHWTVLSWLFWPASGIISIFFFLSLIFVAFHELIFGQLILNS